MNESTSAPARPTGGRIRLAAVVLAALVALGSVLVWASIPSTPVRVMGTEGDGKITLVLAVLGVVFLVAFGRRRWGRIIQLVCAALVVAIAVIDTLNLRRVASASLLNVSIGAGLVMVLVAGIAWLVVSALLVRRLR